MTKDKLLSVLFYMWNNNMSFATQNGSQFFNEFLKNNNVSEKDLQKKSYYQICKQYWKIDITELTSLVYSLMELKRIDFDKYKEKIQELKINEMFKS